MHCRPPLSSQTSVFFFQMNVFLKSVKQLSGLEFIQSHCNIFPPSPPQKRKEIKSLLLQNKSVFFSFMVRLFFPFCDVCPVAWSAITRKQWSHEYTYKMVRFYYLCLLVCRSGTLLRSLGAQVPDAVRCAVALVSDVSPPHPSAVYSSDLKNLTDVDRKETASFMIQHSLPLLHAFILKRLRNRFL